MKKVQPIRDKVTLNNFKNELKKKDEKYYAMTLIGLNSGLRISDILNLKVNDVINADGTVKSHITLIEKKTQKHKRFLINKPLQNELKSYITKNNLKDTDYLIYSNKKDGNGNQKAISRIQAYNVLKETSEKLNIDDVGTHTLRKTFGYWYYRTYKDVAILQEIFNHSAPSITLRYIGITDDEIDKTLKDFYI